MRVADFVAELLVEHGVRQVFGVSGGASLHLLDAINNNQSLKLTCLHHEQSVAMAAEAFSRASRTLGVGVTTSGPGATNLITGIAGAYYDSIPVLYLTGQVSTTRMKGEKAVRQIGFQETPIVEMVASITKYAVTVTSSSNIEREIHKGIQLAVSGRKGPVLIDIPDDIQREGYLRRSPVECKCFSNPSGFLEDGLPAEVGKALSDSTNPIIICGAGVNHSKYRSRAIDGLTQMAIPVALTWGAKDLLPHESNFLLGSFGTHGDRFVNIALNEADLIISLGSRLDLKSTGTPVSGFAPNARKIMIDIDRSEMEKFHNSGFELMSLVTANLDSDDLSIIFEELSSVSLRLDQWKATLKDLRTRIPAEPRRFVGDGVNPYQFISTLSNLVGENVNLVLDTGCAIAWTMQEWRVKKNQRIFHDFNNTAMGWSIPAAIASGLANSDSLQIALIGDGSLMMALSDLVSLADISGNVKVIILNNSGYSMIRQTQDQWFDSHYFASEANKDLSFPNFEEIANACRFHYYSIQTDAGIHDTLRKVLTDSHPLVCEVKIQESARVIPIVKAGFPNHVMEPHMNF